MNYQDMKKAISTMANENYEDFIKVMVSVEKGIDNKEALDSIYQDYMDGGLSGLLHEDFDYKIDELREQGVIMETANNEADRDDLLNLVGNVVGDVDIVSRTNKEGVPFTVVNFSLVSKDDDGNKNYMNCSAYGEKGIVPKDFKQGDFVKVFGQLRTNTDEQGKEHHSLRILSSKLLKAREQMKDMPKEKDSILGSIKKFKNEEKANKVEKEKSDKGQER